MTRFYAVTFVEGNFDRTASVLAFESKKDRAGHGATSTQKVAPITAIAKNKLMREGRLMRLALRNDAGECVVWGV